MSTNSEELFFSYADYSMWNQVEFVTLGEFIYLINGFDPLGIRLHDKKISANDQVGYEQVFMDFSEGKFDDFKSSWKKITRMGLELPTQSDTQTEVRYLKDTLPHYEAVFLIQWGRSKNIQINPNYSPVESEERRSKKFIQDYEGRVALFRDEFIKILVLYNSGKDEKYFKTRLLEAIEVGVLKSIGLPFNYAVPFEDRNFKFRIQSLIEYAMEMEWNVPEEFVEVQHETSNKKYTTNNEIDIQPNKLKSLHKMILAMAVAKYNFNPKGNRNTASGGNAGSIKADVQALGSTLDFPDLNLNIDEATVKDRLDEAVDALLK